MKLTAPSRFAWLGVLLLFALLATLAVLQFHWTGELSRAEAERLRRSLDTAAGRVAHEVDREISRAFLQFRPPVVSDRRTVEAQAQSALADWREARFPDLVSEVMLIDLTTRPMPQAQTLGRKETAWKPIPWPPREGGLGLAEAVESRLAEIAEPRQVRFANRVLAPELPGLIYPWIAEPPPDEPRRPGSWRMRVSGFVVVLLDRRVLAERILPGLVDDLLVRHLGPRPVSLEVPGEPPVALTAEPAPAAGRSARDLTLAVFDLVSFDELSRLSFLRDGHAIDLTEEGRLLRDPLPAGEPPPVRFLGPWIGAPIGPARLAMSGWRLRFYDPGAAVDAVVDRARRRNLVLGFGVLTVLGLSSAALVEFSRRTHRLARRQLEFVAAVSHELRTPLAAIRALGQNLDDGVVREGESVRQYGRRIVLESGRLGELVERTLALGGILSGRGGRNHALVPLDEVARRAVAECASLGKENGVEMTLTVAAAPTVSADPMALHGAVVNLLVNALRFGTGPVTVTVGEARRGRGTMATLAVADRGPGIAKEDLPRLFEPFFRGQNALARRIPGSGLGLSLVRHAVEAAGGSVELATGEGEGTVFTLFLPARREKESDGTTDPAGRG